MSVCYVSHIDSMAASIVQLRKHLPNWLTYFRIAVIPALVVAFFIKDEIGDVLCALLFLTACITDWLDGYLARSWQAESSIGRFLDPIADKLLVATALLLLVSHGREYVYEGRAMIIPAIAIVCREILVSGLREFLAELRVSVPVSRLAKWKTGVQMTAIFLLLLGPAGPSASKWLNTAVLGNALLWLAALLTLVTGYAYLKTGWAHLNRDGAPP